MEEIARKTADVLKLDNAFRSLREGTVRVTIKQASDLLDPGAGTVISL